MLYDNLIIIFIGIVLVAISLYFIVKQNNNEEEDYYYRASLLMNNNATDAKNSQKLLHDQMASIMEELEVMKQKLEWLEAHQNTSPKADKAVAVAEEEIPFNHALNYQLFINRNEDIIKLYNEGRSIDEIAKTSNKSFREVEMIIKLVK